MGFTLAGSVMYRSRVRRSVRLSVCSVGILTMTYQGAACDAASVHLGSTVRRNDMERDADATWAFPVN